MFIVPAKTAIVEALRAVWFQDQDGNEINPELTAADRPFPRRITIEYAEEPDDWPFILVQVRPSLITWTGITPDEIYNAGTEESPSFKRIRQGRFEAQVMLQIIALSSEERDRMWDNCIQLLMLGKTRNPTRNFFDIIDSHDLIGMTVMEGQVRPIGDSIGVGTPWNAEILTYESAIEFDITGVFYADEYNSDLLPLSEARIYDYVDLGRGEYGYYSTEQDEDGETRNRFRTHNSPPNGEGGSEQWL